MLGDIQYLSSLHPEYDTEGSHDGLTVLLLVAIDWLLVTLHTLHKELVHSFQHAVQQLAGVLLLFCVALGEFQCLVWCLTLQSSFQEQGLTYILYNTV
jgi:hypothetical protein